MTLTVVTWNVNGYVQRTQAEFLGSLEWDVACLQEVTRASWSRFRVLADDGDVAFHHLPPLASAGPRYACAVLVREPTRLVKLGVLPDMPSPERAELALLEIDGQHCWVGSWAAPPGVNWGKAGKGRQVDRFASWLADRPGPTIIGIDRNAPRWERHDLSEDEWWNGREPLMYGPDRVHDLRDVYRDHLTRDLGAAERVRRDFPDGPLAVTHVRGGVPCRYDAVYASPEFAVDAVEHHWADAVAAGSDHALVRATLHFESPGRGASGTIGA